VPGSDEIWRWHHEDVHVGVMASGRWHVVAVVTDVTERKHIGTGLICKPKRQWRRR